MLDNEILKLPMTRETLADRLLKELQERIISGQLPSGEKLSEPGIAKEFGVSRVPAREALQRLEEMGLVKKTYLGREVVKFDKESFRQTTELKIIVEAYGTMQGALNATEADIQHIERLLKKMEAAITASDLQFRLDLNKEFHDYLVQCSRNQKIIDTFNDLATKVRWILPYSLRGHSDPVKAHQGHLAIFEAFRQRDGVKVRALMEELSNASLQRILTKVDFPD